MEKNNTKRLKQTQVSRLKSRIGKPFTTREGVKQMKHVKEFVSNLPRLVKLVLENICLVTKHRQMQRKLMWFVLVERRFI